MAGRGGGGSSSPAALPLRLASAYRRLTTLHTALIRYCTLNASSKGDRPCPPVEFDPRIIDRRSSQIPDVRPERIGNTRLGQATKRRGRVGGGAGIHVGGNEDVRTFPERHRQWTEAPMVTVSDLHETHVDLILHRVEISGHYNNGAFGQLRKIEVRKHARRRRLTPPAGRAQAAAVP